MRISPAEFKREIAQAMDRIPRFLRQAADEAGIAVIAEDQPPPEEAGEPAFAEFVGPTSAQFAIAESAHPPTIVFYRKTFESACSTHHQLKDELYRTLVHELGHFLGFEEDEINDV